MIKVPGTPEGIPAIEQLIGDGINVNVTLLFALEAYERTALAYIAGLEQFTSKGGDPSRVETGRLADLNLLFRDLEGLTEKGHDVLGDHEALRCAGRVGIGTSRVGNDRDAHCVGVRLGSPDISARSFDAPTDPAEQIDFVGNLKTGIEAGRRIGLAIFATA